MIIDVADFKSRKALAVIINKQMETNENLSNENEMLNQNQRLTIVLDFSKLLNLLKMKDGKVEKYKAKLNIVEKYPQLDSNKVEFLMRKMIETQNLIPLRCALIQFYNNNRNIKNRKQCRSQAALFIHGSLSKILMVRSHLFFQYCNFYVSQKKLKHNQSIRILNNLFGTCKSQQSQSQRKVLQIFRRNKDSYKMKLKMLRHILIISSNSVKQQKHTAFKQLCLIMQNGHKVKSNQNSSQLFRVLVNYTKRKHLQFGVKKILEFIKYKEKASIQIQFYQLKQFSRNFIFMVKMNQLVNKKNQTLVVQFFCNLKSQKNCDKQTIRQYKTIEAYNKLVNKVKFNKQWVLNKLKPQIFKNKSQLGHPLKGVENSIKLMKKVSLIRSFQIILQFSKNNFNPFKTLNEINSNKIIRLTSKTCNNKRHKKISKNKCTINKARHSYFRSTILNQKLKLKQLSLHFKDSMSQFMVKSSEMIKIFETANKKQDQEQTSLKQTIQSDQDNHKQKIQEFIMQYNQLKGELSNQVSQKVEVEMILHQKEQECSGLQNKIQFTQKELNQLRYEIQRMNEQEKKITHNVDHAYKEKFETVQKLEESYMTLRQLKQEYDNLKQGYQKLEKYNLDLLSDNDQKQQQIIHLGNKLEEYEVTVELMHVKLNHHMQQSQVQEISNSRYSSKSASRKNSQNDQNQNDQINRLKLQNMEITKEAIQLNEEKLSMKEVIGSQSEQISLLQTQKLQSDQKAQQLMKLVEETQGLKNRDQNQSQKLIKLENQNQTLLQNLTQSENNIENIKKHYYVQMQHQSKDQDQLQGQIEALKQTINNNSQINESEIQDLRAGVGDLNREKINLMRELTLEHEQKLKVEKECISLKEQAKTYQQELDSYQSQLDLYVKVLKQMDEKIKKQT